MITPPVNTSQIRDLKMEVVSQEINDTLKRKYALKAKDSLALTLYYNELKGLYLDIRVNEKSLKRFDNISYHLSKKFFNLLFWKNKELKLNNKLKYVQANEGNKLTYEFEKKEKKLLLKKVTKRTEGGQDTSRVEVSFYYQKSDGEIYIPNRLKIDGEYFVFARDHSGDYERKIEENIVFSNKKLNKSFALKFFAKRDVKSVGYKL